MMTTDTANAPEVSADGGAAQQDADLSQLEFVAAQEDWQPSDDPALGDPSQQDAPEMSTGELCTSLLAIGFGLVASRRGDHWALNEQEATETGQAIGAVLDKYFPDLSGQGVELVALSTCAMVLMPRVMQDKAIAKQAEQRAAVERRQQAAQGHEETGPAPQPNGEAQEVGVRLDGD